jgi:hypothetical protein
MNTYFIKMNLCIGFIFCQSSDITVEETSSSESLSFTNAIELTLAVSGRYYSTRLGEVKEDQSAICTLRNR